MAQYSTLIEERASSGIVKDYYTYFSGQQTYNAPPYTYKVEMDMVQTDPVLFTAVSLTVDLSMNNGFEFAGEGDFTEIKKKFRSLNFTETIRNILWQMVVYGDAYLEVKWNETRTEVMELHPLETSEMVMKYNEFGEVKYYLQRVNGKSEADWIRFEVDDVIYFRRYWVGSQVYSQCPFKSIAKSYATKVYANDYLQSIFRNLPPKIIYFLKNANDKQRKLFIENLLRAKTNPNMDIIAQGEAFDSKVAQVDFGSTGFVEILNYLRHEILMITRVPPHWVGLLDGANRGIAESVTIPFEVAINQLQECVADKINRELMPKLKYESTEFMFAATTLMDEKAVLENMNSLKTQGFDEETIIQYGNERGLGLRQDAKIEKPEMNPLQSKNPFAKKSDNMTNNLNSKGVSDEGRAKLEKRQLEAKA